MGTRFGIEMDVARLAGNLATAWESGDRHLLESVVRATASELKEVPPASALTSEFRELLLGITESMDRLLATSQPGDLRQGSQGKVCYDLLRHAQGAAAAACPAPQV